MPSKIVSHYEIKVFEDGDKIPNDAIFLESFRYDTGRTFGWASNPQRLFKTAYRYQVPVYRKSKGLSAKATGKPVKA